MPKARKRTVEKTSQEKSLNRIQSELWHLGMASQNLEGSQDALDSTLEDLGTKIDSLTEAVEDLTTTIKDSMRLVDEQSKSSRNT